MYMYMYMHMYMYMYMYMYMHMYMYMYMHMYNIFTMDMHYNHRSIPGSVEYCGESLPPVAAIQQPQPARRHRCP